MKLAQYLQWLTSLNTTEIRLTLITIGVFSALVLFTAFVFAKCVG